MTANAEAKRRRIRRVQRYLVNPPAKLAVGLGLIPGYALLETTGRKSGKKRRTVVGVHRDDQGAVWIVAEQGRHAGYVQNLMADPRVRVRIGRRWRSGTARVVDGDDVDARLRSFGRPAHVRAVRRFGTELLSIRIELDESAS
jgi:deazaflavin-dependent oxidoreductase (nitroreductase family)